MEAASHRARYGRKLADRADIEAFYRATILESSFVKHNIMQMDLAELEGNPTTHAFVNFVLRSSPNTELRSSAKNLSRVVGSLTMVGAIATAILVLAETFINTSVGFILPTGMSVFASVAGVGGFLSYRVFRAK
jgi:hypothetical protein